MSFHDQFATNQNHHRSIFVQIIVVLVPLLTGYGYLYTGLSTESARNLNGAVLYAYLLISGMIISLEIAVLLILSVSYRRDQYVSARMREKVNVLTRGSNQNFFPGSFLPIGRRGILNWVPDYNLVFIVMLLGLKGVFFLTTIYHPNLAIPLQCSDLSFLQLSSLISFVALFIVDALIFYIYRRKWTKYLEEYEAES